MLPFKTGNHSLLKMRVVYFLVTGVVLAAGYLSRRWSVRGSFVHDYAGDAVWAAMIYFGFRMLLTKAPLKMAMAAALITTWFIEVTQLYQAPWLNAVRHTWLGGLVLGYSFLWSDLVMYSVGIVSAWWVDHLVSEKRKHSL